MVVVIMGLPDHVEGVLLDIEGIVVVRGKRMPVGDEEIALVFVL